jgi:ABC-type Fe3+-hydroxamate transport system substrate-binding protein
MLKATVNQSVAIAQSASASSEAESLGLMLVGIVMPAAFTGTELAIHAGATAGGTMAVYDDVGATVTVPVGTSRYVNMAWAKLTAPYVKVVSNGTEAAARTLTLVFGEA